MVGARTREHQDEDDDSDQLEGDDAADDDDDAGDLDEVDDVPSVDPDDSLDEDAALASAWTLPFPIEEKDAWELRHARRRGGESSYRHQRPNQFYPMWIDPEAGRVVRAGEAPPLEEEPSFEDVDGLIPVWPLDKDGNERCWRLIPSSMQALIDEGRVVLGQVAADGRSWTINLWVRRTMRKKYKTVWWNKQHDAGTHGTSLLAKFLDKRNAFPFPKSVYAVRDTLLAVVRDRPNALILDFFAGSGTTLHATALINAQDGGNRQCILVTNNEVDAKTTKRLVRQKLLPGDAKFEQHGIFWQATKPRVTAALTGKTPTGKRIVGKYSDGTAFASGLDENVEFFELIYLDRDQVSGGEQFASIEPALWLMSGGVGQRTVSDPAADYSIASESNYAILFKRSAFSALNRELRKRPELNRVFLVCDSESAYNQMRSKLPAGVESSMLYRDYLRNFRINTLEAWR